MSDRVVEIFGHVNLKRRWLPRPRHHWLVQALGYHTDRCRACGQTRTWSAKLNRWLYNGAHLRPAVPWVSRSCSGRCSISRPKS
ncbi:MAG TPA: hypothetical protein VMB50_20755 [Myxococcales bacterium]|nr:hypothetical protein [Myxococcales bacterium]